MDRYWYHVFLRGAVKHAADIEEQFKDKIPGIGLGRTISEVSGAVRIFGLTMNSTTRLTSFYGLGFLMLVIVFFFLVFAKPDRPPVTSNVQGAPPQLMWSHHFPDIF